MSRYIAPMLKIFPTEEQATEHNEMFFGGKATVEMIGGIIQYILVLDNKTLRIDGTFQ